MALAVRRERRGGRGGVPGVGAGQHVRRGRAGAGRGAGTSTRVASGWLVRRCRTGGSRGRELSLPARRRRCVSGSRVACAARGGARCVGGGGPGGVSLGG